MGCLISSLIGLNYTIRVMGGLIGLMGGLICIFGGLICIFGGLIGL